ncbi:MAG: RNA methyltransferase [Bacteroidota bacterium]
MLPLAFQDQMKALLGGEYTDFTHALVQATPVSLRLNAAKIAARPVTSGFETPVLALFPEIKQTPVPWHPQGIYLAERPVFTLDPLIHAGAYYVQEAASMLLYQALIQYGDFSKSLNVLDLCAAPGGKSTLIASLLNHESLLVANEVIRARVGVLRENLEKWGCPNIAVTSAESEVFAENLPEFFDIVVTDAPCSGEGLFRKDPDAIKEWSPENVQLCAGRQRRILSSAVETLAPGGLLIYSTCTYNRLENEENITWLASEFGLDILPLQSDPAWGLVESEGGYHCYPHRLQGEGFFIAILRKKAGHQPKRNIPNGFISLKPVPKSLVPEITRWLNPGWPMRLFTLPAGEILALPAALENAYLSLDKALKNKWFGVNIGEIKGKDFIPSHALALSNAAASTLPALELSKQQALLLLKKETFEIHPDAPRGWVLARYAGFNLGWMKILPNRMNNYLPQERKIRMELERE